MYRKDLTAIHLCLHLPGMSFLRGTAPVGEENLPHYFCIIVKVTWRKEIFLLHTSGQT